MCIIGKKRTQNTVDEDVRHNNRKKNSHRMKKATVLHNPDAGEGEISEKELVREIESAGFKCSYSSTKEFRWENIDTDESDFLVLAGGDGTVRKIAEELLARQVIEKIPPLALLPFGTANNIARTLGLSLDTRQIIEGWHTGNVKKFDVGKIDGLDTPSFFLESFGYGLFPKLMLGMKKEKKNDIDDPKEKLLVALEMLHDLILSAPLKKCDLQINDKDYSGSLLLLEVMNIRSIGPNLTLAPDADPGDGEFDVVLVTERQRSALADYVGKKIRGIEIPFEFPIIKAKELSVFWHGRHGHVDDEYCRVEKAAEIKIELRKALLEFLVPVN
jgi:diacylglycerol kinase (ATP)